MFIDFLLGAIAVGVFVLAVAWISSLAGNADPARGTWGLWVFAGLLLFFAIVQRSALFVGAAVGGVAGTSVFVLWSRRHSERRDEDSSALGAELGLAYEQEASSTELGDLVSPLTSPGARNEVRHVLSGRWRDKDVKLFDYSFEIKGPDSTLHRNYTCAMVAAPLDNEPIAITAETLLTRIASRVVSPDLQVGDASFDRVFNIRSKDAAAAREVLRPQVRSWLTKHGQGLSFLVGHGVVLCVAGHGVMSPKQLLELVWRFGELVSPTSAEAALPPSIHTPIARAATAPSAERKRPAGTRQARGFGLIVAIVTPIALAIGAYLLFYVACATGRGCL